MKLVQISRKTRTERGYTSKMGMMRAKVTYVKKTVLGIPIKTLHKYRETYYGKVKECGQCDLTV